jgi:hypothetical protein
MASQDQAFREDECLSVQAKALPFLETSVRVDQWTRRHVLD